MLYDLYYYDYMTMLTYYNCNLRGKCENQKLVSAS